MMNFPVEIKVNVEDAIDDAISAFEQPRDPKSKRKIWFAEDRNGLAGAHLALADGRVTIRIRSGHMDADDLTVKFRPCVEAEVVSFDPSESDSFEYRVEGDWSGQRRVMAASAVSLHPRGSLFDAVAAGIDPAALLNAAQRQFVDMCVPWVTIDHLVMLGPIASVKFGDLRLNDLNINMERWTVGHLDFLELSSRVKPKNDEGAARFQSRVERKQQELEELVRRRGVPISEDRESKTRRALTELATAWRLKATG